MESEKPKNIYTTQNIKKTTLARIRAIVKTQNERDKTAKPNTVSWFINSALERAATEAEKDGEKCSSH